MTTKTTEARREAFNKWHSKLALGHMVKEEAEAAMTLWAHKEILWVGYNAALDSLCVELPDIHDQPVEDHYNWAACKEACIAALTAAGVPYK